MSLTVALERDFEFRIITNLQSCSLQIQEMCETWSAGKSNGLRNNY